MPDGQLKSHLIRVYVSRNIRPAENPELCLLRSHAITEKTAKEFEPRKPILVAPSYHWNEYVDGTLTPQTKTLLLFDLNEMPGFGLKPMLRVTPVVRWTENGKAIRLAVGENEVSVANIVADIFWTGGIAGLGLLLVIWLSWKAARTPLLLLSGVDGHLSLAQTQVACWTVAVGGVALGYGLIRLEIPEIPPSLLALMGGSLATAGIGYFRDEKKQVEAEGQ